MSKIKKLHVGIILSYIALTVFYLLAGLFINQLKIKINHIPQAVYLIVLVGLFFLYLIVFLFMLFQFLCRKDLAYILILGMAFLSCNIYFSETIIIIQSLLSNSLSLETQTNDIALFYFFRQMNFISLLIIAIISYDNEYQIIETKKRKPCFILLSTSITIIIAVLAHNLSSYNPTFMLDIVSIKDDVKGVHVHWNLGYIYFIITLWVCVLGILTIKTKLKNALWVSIALLCCSAILSNIILIKLDEYNLYIWYISRGMEIICAMCVISILMHNTFVLLKKETESSIKDEMTKIYNRKLFYKVLKLSIKKGMVCVVMLDIDKFKRINDTYGHQEGDNVIITIVDIIKKSVRDCDIFARLGGEEFALILKNTEQSEAILMAERIRKNVEDKTCPPNEYKLKEKMTISLGVYCTRIEDDSVDKIVSYADIALYKAKNSGRNKTVCYD
ncbi:GGDEF domain-containing protein [Hafnia paralvei]|uniref:sensor domain-containing diguanylate cyclase n=1 Tax=Hafnia paralvei TaxID=546367 RepID=UPI001C04961C|nr:sensor domain-containing diguanylate cyclase [Hafnia paralvei]MBU2672436.1 GGDEF domain-containing protein [Hafnia paralvei]